jgi:dTDP-L-rhamnose 4-epimerase
LVTGGAGFIGSHLIPELLRGGFEVRVFDSLAPQVHGALPQGLDWLSDGTVEFIRGSITCPDDVQRALDRVGAVVHLAAETGTGQSMYQIARYNEVNCQGMANLLDVLANNKKHRVERIVLASSRSIYGEGAYICEWCAPGTRVYPNSRSADALATHHWDPVCVHCGGGLTAVPTREDDPARPASIYAATKFAQEDLVRVACSSLGIGYAIMRLQNVYGERQSLNNPYTGIVSIFSTRIRRGLHLPIFEDGLETRDFVHVEDVANAFVAALRCETAINSAVNVGRGVKTTVAAIAEQLSIAFGATPNLVVTGQYRLGDIRHNCADVGLLDQLLGCVPRIDLATGLGRFAAWVATQPLPEDRLEAANAELRARKMMPSLPQPGQ